MNDAPPRWLASVAGVLLPPSRREAILGDLEERYRAADPARARRQYLIDTVALVPAVFWSERGHWHIGGDAPPRLRLAQGAIAVRAQVEDFQQENHCRTLFYSSAIALIAALTVWQLASRDHWPARLYLLLVLAAQLFTVYQHHRRGSGEAVPAGASLPALVAFHRRALERRRDFLLTLWYWKMLPLGIPILMAMALGRDGVVAPTIALACFTLAWIATRSQARRVSQQIDELERLTR